MVRSSKLGVGALTVVAAALVACTGNITGETPPSAAAAGSANQPPQPPGGGTASFEDAPADPLAAGPLPMRLLNATEYRNTVQDLLGVEADVANLFPPESQSETGFAKVQKVDQVSVTAYQEAALRIADTALSTPSTLLGCDPTGANETTCVESFVTAFGQRAFRRPLTSSEVAEHVTFYRDVLRAQQRASVGDALKLLLVAILESPHFLYRWENGSQVAAHEQQVLKLNPYHLASQLSYFLWSSMPDTALFEAASAGQLSTPADVEAQARRMLTDPRAERSIAAFHEQWLAVTALAERGKSTGAYPSWNADLGAAMSEEIRRFTSNVLLHGDGRLVSLFSGRTSFVNQPLAELYGISGVTGAAFQLRDLPSEQRAGLFTLAGFLTAHANETEGSPIDRGKFIRERVLCDAMQPPPPGIPPLAPPSPDTTIKQRHLEHAAVSPCKDCHLRMDYIGFGLDNFDAIGAYHATDGQTPVDASGQIYGLDGRDPTFKGPNELMALLAGSEQVRQCLAKQWFRYAFARRELPGDRASFDAAFDAFAKSDFDLRELLVAYSASRTFRYRSLDEGEVDP
jgi:Protein of unknown function (DUF1592)/Protein of unknown function (DUF1588)/Protein of unknown function (DUF1595)/Protein of unknown function (DUF1587)/Protein of unknown function (DUF1585)